jgi:hypothetical protein
MLLALYSYVVSMVPPLRARASRSAVAQEGFRWCVGRLLSLCEIFAARSAFIPLLRRRATSGPLGFWPRAMETASGM